MIFRFCFAGEFEIEIVGNQPELQHRLSGCGGFLRPEMPAKTSAERGRFAVSDHRKLSAFNDGFIAFFTHAAVFRRLR